jgi:hypothetical protein
MYCAKPVVVYCLNKNKCFFDKNKYLQEKQKIEKENSYWVNKKIEIYQKYLAQK